MNKSLICVLVLGVAFAAAASNPQVNLVAEGGDVLNKQVDTQNDAATGDMSDPAAIKDDAAADETEGSGLGGMDDDGGSGTVQGLEQPKDSTEAPEPSSLPPLPQTFYTPSVSNAEGVNPPLPDADLRDTERQQDPQVAKAAIERDPVTDMQGTDDIAEEDEEKENSDDDEEQMSERAHSAAMDAEAHRKIKPPTEIEENLRRPDWPLALLATPRLPTTPRQLNRDRMPEELVLNYDSQNKFKERGGVRIPHSKAFDTPNWTISFWLKLDASATVSGWHSILNKGHNSKDRAPGIWLSNENRLWVRAYTSHHWDEGFHSGSTLVAGVANHITLIRRGRTFVLFVNGLVDTTFTAVGEILSNDGPLHISRSPGYLGFNGELWGLRWYARGLLEAEVTAISSVGTERPVLALNFRKTFTNDDLDVVNIPHSPALETKDFTVAFWLTLETDSTQEYRSIFHKGDMKEMTPSCFMRPGERKLECIISTTHEEVQRIISTAVMPISTPVHVALIRHGDTLQLYVDGEKDAEVKTKGLTLANGNHLNIGSSRFEIDGEKYNAAVVGEIPYFRWFSHAFDIVEVRLNMERTSRRPVLSLNQRMVFQPTDYTVMPHKPAFRSQGLTVQFWLNLQPQPARKERKDQPEKSWACIFRKGDSDQEYTPSLWFKPSEKASRLQIRVSTSHNFRETFDAANKIPVNTPTRVALVLEGKVIKLYINDVEDSVFVMRGVPVLNFGALYLGSDPWNQGIKGSIENFEWFDRPLLQRELRTISPHGKFRFWTPPLTDGPLIDSDSKWDFTGFNSVTFPDRDIRSKTVSVAFWLNLKEAPRTVSRVIFSKGEKKNEQTLSLYLTPGGRLQFAASTTNNKAAPETKRSAVVLETNSPYHIALTLSEGTMKLYVNGIMDSYLALKGKVLLNTGRMFVGKDLFRAGMVGTISQFHYFPFELSELDIKSLGTGKAQKATLDMQFNGEFNGQNILKIPHSSALDGSEMTVSAWVTLTGDSTAEWRTILHKGDSNNQKTPSILLRPNTRKVQAYASTTREAVDSLTSEHIIALNVPTLITYVIQAREHRLYINGVLDAKGDLSGEAVFNEGPLMVGKDLWHSGFQGTINAVQVYNRALREREIMEFSPARHVENSLSFSNPGVLDGREGMIVPHSAVFDTSEYTMMTWITLRGKPTEDWVSIVHKGSKNAERSPGLFLYPQQQKIFAALSTKKSMASGITANVTLEHSVPTHVAYVLSKDSLKLFVNGNLAGWMRLESEVVLNKGPLYIGKDAWYPGFEGVITGFRIIPFALDAVKIRQQMALDERF